MKVFKFHCSEYVYAFSAPTKEEATKKLTEFTNDEVTSVEEIPESEWDKRNMDIYEDNNTDLKLFKVSIRDLIIDTKPQMLFTNDPFFD